MKDYFKNITRVDLDDEFIQLLDSFEKKYGSKETAIEKFAECIGFCYLVDKDDVRGYEGVPFEMILPFATGSDGEHMGWIDLCPTDSRFKKPFVTWAPMGGYVFYHGTEIIEIMSNLTRCIHEDNNYDDIDLDFLNGINVFPDKGRPVELNLNFEGELKDLPVDIPKGFVFKQTLDGTGVLANEDLFDISFKLQDYSDIEALLKNGTDYLDSKPATALEISKNLYFNIWHEGINNKYYLSILELLSRSYDTLGMKRAKELVNNEIKKAYNNI